MNLNKTKRTLYLVRHAKAFKPSAGIADIDRPLHDTGILEAYEMANELVGHHNNPQLIITSTAARASATALIFQRVLAIDSGMVKVSDHLYEIDVNELYEFVAGLDDAYHSIMLVGHNPAFSSFAHKMDPSLMHIPTAGIVMIDFEVEKWEHSSYINAEQKLFVFP